MSARPYASFYSKDMRQANRTRYSARGNSASPEGAVQAAVKKLQAKLFRRVDIYGKSGRLLYSVQAGPKGQIIVHKVQTSVGRAYHVDSDIAKQMTHLYH